MAYRIEYGPPLPPAKEDKLPLRLIGLTGLFFSLFLLTVRFVWPDSAEKLSQLLLPFGNAPEAQQAVETFLSDLRSGDPFPDAFTAFCRQIIAYGSIPPA